MIIYLGSLSLSLSHREKAPRITGGPQIGKLRRAEPNHSRLTAAVSRARSRIQPRQITTRLRTFDKHPRRAAISDSRRTLFD